MSAVATLAGAVPRREVDWHSINWKKVHRTVRRLQMRIVKAVRAGKWHKVKVLVYLLTHSFSGRATAILRVVSNSGAKTPGVDGATWNTPEAKSEAFDRKWLNAGYLEKRRLFATTEGTPQGGIISPVLANRALDGLQEKLAERFANTSHRKCKVHLVRYADDFIIIGTSKVLLKDEVQPLVEHFLQERGLELSHEKTKVTPINRGFDFYRGVWSGARVLHC